MLNVRDRFLIAFAKILGENPTRPSPLANVQVCEDWFIDELLRPILPGGETVALTRDRFNQLMLNCGRTIATNHFFEYFFSSAQTIVQFEVAVDAFRVKAMWLFGNFKYGYKRSATVNVGTFRELIARTDPKLPDDFASRTPFSDIENIPEQDLGYLGYVSGQEVKDLSLTVDSLDVLLGAWADREIFLERLGPENRSRISAILRTRGLEFPSAGEFKTGRTDLENKLQELKAELSDAKRRQVNAQEIGLRNTHRYFTMPYLDVYVATSMRSASDYVEQHRFIEAVFGHAEVKKLRLRYFDPTVSYDPDRIKKGLIECLMLRRASVTLYNAGAEDTMGKDSELAATLAQGKPVIVYVPSAPPKPIYTCPKCGELRKVDFDRRANIFRADHPLDLPPEN